MRDFKNPVKEFLPRKLLASVAIAALVAGCSSVPDAINPVEWYKSAKDAVVGTDDPNEDAAEVSRQAVPGENDSIPKVSSVPERPKATVAEERKRIADGLVADQAEARKYSNDVIRRQGDAANPLPAPPPPTVNVKPAHQATPKTPVAEVKTTTPIVTPKPEPKPMAAPKPAAMATPKAPQVTAMAKPQPTSPQLRVAPPSPMVKVPAVNPNPPRLGAIPGLESLGQGETVVISGGGVQTIGGVGRVQSRPSAPSAARVNVSGVNSLAQFNPNNLQGSYQVATILFANGSSRVGARDRRVLRQVIAQHKQVGGTLRIVGHASKRTKTNDPIRHKMANFQVSTARAERIAKELVKMGVRADRLYVGSVSDSEPRYYEYMPSGEAGNRRTEIYIDF